MAALKRLFLNGLRFSHFPFVADVPHCALPYCNHGGGLQRRADVHLVHHLGGDRVPHSRDVRDGDVF